MVYRQKATQLSLESFGSALGTPLSPDNEWVQYAELIPWDNKCKPYLPEMPMLWDLPLHLSLTYRRN